MNIENLKHPSRDSEPQATDIGLVVSDDVLRTALRLLLHVSGFRVREYRFPGEYLASPADSHDCLVVDCSLPDISGRRLCERVLEREQRTPILVVTGSLEEIDPPFTTKKVIHVLRKPFDGNLLIEAIHEAMGAASPGHDPDPRSPPVVDAGA